VFRPDTRAACCAGSSTGSLVSGQLIDLLIEEGDPAGALQHAELARSRGLAGPASNLTAAAQVWTALVLWRHACAAGRGIVTSS